MPSPQAALDVVKRAQEANAVKDSTDLDRAAVETHDDDDDDSIADSDDDASEADSDDEKAAQIPANLEVQGMGSCLDFWD